MKEDTRMKQQSLTEAVDFYNYNSYLKKIGWSQLQSLLILSHVLL